VHPDTIALCRNIAQHFRLVCLGIDVLTDDISHSWKDGNFGIIEINAAPGIFMHLNPAEGLPVDVPSRIVETFFSAPADATIPILTFNRLSKVELRRILDFVLQTNLKINPGGVCEESVYMRREELPQHKDYNSNIRNLIRNPRLDLLVAECPEAVYASEGQYYEGIRLLVLDEPSDLERRMASNLSEDGVVMTRVGDEVTILRGSESETHILSIGDEFTSLYMREIKLICESIAE
jgi:cyanophycin synthetase